jgi:hypothetical protein
MRILIAGILFSLSACTAMFDDDETNLDGECYVGGCSAELCSDTPNVASTCEWQDAYSCYSNATCERQAHGECGWTQTEELKACLAAH